METKVNKNAQSASGVLSDLANKPSIPAPVVVKPVEADLIPAMTGQERDDLEFHERIIENAADQIKQGFVAIGKSLGVIKAQRLWRDDYASFDDYCERRWGFGGRRGEQVISGAAAYLYIEQNAPELARYLDSSSKAETTATVPDEDKVPLLQKSVSEAADQGKDKPTDKIIKKNAAAKKKKKPTGKPKQPKTKVGYDALTVRTPTVEDAKAVRKLFAEAGLELVNNNPEALFLKTVKVDPQKAGGFLGLFANWIATQPVKEGLVLSLES